MRRAGLGCREEQQIARRRRSSPNLPADRELLAYARWQRDPCRAKTCCVKPLQSNPCGSAPPSLYRMPLRSSAVPTSAYQFAGSRLLGSGRRRRRRPRGPSVAFPPVPACGNGLRDRARRGAGRRTGWRRPAPVSSTPKRIRTRHQTLILSASAAAAPQPLTGALRVVYTVPAS